MKYRYKEQKEVDYWYKYEKYPFDLLIYFQNKL